jgi:hypothetical protein
MGASEIVSVRLLWCAYDDADDLEAGMLSAPHQDLAGQEMARFGLGGPTDSSKLANDDPAPLRAKNWWRVGCE